MDQVHFILFTMVHANLLWLFVDEQGMEVIHQGQSSQRLSPVNIVI